LRARLVLLDSFKVALVRWRVCRVLQARFAVEVG